MPLLKRGALHCAPLAPRFRKSLCAHLKTTPISSFKKMIFGLGFGGWQKSFFWKWIKTSAKTQRASAKNLRACLALAKNQTRNAGSTLKDCGGVKSLLTCLLMRLLGGFDIIHHRLRTLLLLFNPRVKVGRCIGVFFRNIGIKHQRLFIDKLVFPITQLRR